METIKRGSRGEAVKQAQTLLNQWGYDAGSADGIFGGNTENAVKEFQQNNGLTADGIVGKNTWAALQSGVTLRRGDRGDNVTKLQNILNAKGFNAGNADGIFGENTENAVKAFQQAYGLSVDGIVGPDTWNSLEGEGNLKRGARGEKVKLVQNLLNQKGYNAGSADGIFGGNTESAVKAFQQANGLSADGIVGPKTWAALQSGGGQAAEPASEHFKLSEFACKDGTPVPQQYWGNVQALMNELEKVRAVWGKEITIRSGYRTESWNNIQGGAPLSQHLSANAADIVVSGVSAATVYAKLDEMYPNQGLGKYSDFTHLDLRGHRARW